MSRASVALRAPGRGDRRIRRLFTVLVSIAFVVIAACVRPPLEEPQPAPPVPREPAVARPVVVPPPDPTSLPCPEVLRLEVRKQERVLEAWCRGGGLRVFPIALSREPVGAKRRSGDQRIPEGDYLLVGSPRRSRFHLFIPIDYPSPQDADRGLAEGVISRSEHRRILAAHAAGHLPPQDTALGGLVGFHGEGERWRGDLDLDWTEGCVAVTDEAIGWLAVHAERGTPVAIRP
jgi:L,D-transpeptidase catalytic domain